MAQRYYLLSASGTQIIIEKEVQQLGRAIDNDIVIKDDTISRYHLTLYIKDSQLIAEDAGSQFGFKVNGVISKTAVYLKTGDLLTIGNREYVVQAEGEVANFPKKKSANSNPAPLNITPTASVSSSSSTTFRSAPTRLILYGVAGLILAYVFLMPDEKKPSPKNLDDAPTLSLDKIAPKEEPTKSITEIRSEAKFNEAMRDYNNQLFNRSLLGFQESLTMNPGNELSAEYIEITQKRIKQVLNEAYRDGERSFSTLHYRRTRYQMLKILGILAEQIPGFSRKVARDVASVYASNKRLSEHEKNLLSIPCEKTTEAKLCSNAKILLQISRNRLNEDDVLVGTEGSSQ